MAKTILSGATLGPMRVTIPAREALEASGNIVEAAAALTSALFPAHTVALVRPPRGLELVLIGDGADQHRGLRMTDEPEYPMEWPARLGAIAWHERGQLVPCPRCGAALVWQEAGNVPGYRVCVAAGHRAQLSGDGRSAEPVGGA